MTQLVPALAPEYRELFAAAPAAMLVIAPDGPRFTITGVNDAYLAAVTRTREELVGSALFDAMPDNPDDPGATGVANLRASIERAIATKRPDRMPVQKYDIPRLGTGFEERWWEPRNAPVLGAEGEVIAVIHHVADVTERVRAGAEAKAHVARQEFRLTLEEQLHGLAEPVTMMEEATALLGRHLGVAQVGFAEVEDDQDHITVARDWNDGRVRSVVGRWRMDDFGPQFIRAIRAGETIAFRDVGLDPRICAPEVAVAYEGINTRAILDVPLVRNGRMRALLFIHHSEPRAWVPEEVALVEETCARLWSAVEQARAETASRTSERRLRRAHDAARLGDFTWDVATGVTTLSGEYPRMLGLLPEALPSTAPAFLELIHPDDRDRVLAEAAPLLLGGAERFDAEYRIVRGDGKVVWIAASAESEGRLPDGRAARIVGVNYDVTARRRAEEALRASEARFRLMADAVPAIVWVIDADGANEFFNRQWFDYTGAELKPMTAAAVTRDHVHPDDVERTMAAFEEARSAGNTYLVEHRIRSAAGDYRWFLVRGEPQRHPGTGEITRWFGASVDIHDRKVAEAGLRELNETLERRVDAALAERRVLADLVEGTDAFVQVADQDFRWLAINKAAADEFERIFGRRPEVGDNMLDLLADMPEHQAAVRAVWSRALGGEPFTEIGEFGEMGRDRRFYEMKYDVLRDAGGERIGAYQFVYDVTERIAEQRLLAFARRQPLQPTAVDLGVLIEGMAGLIGSTLGPQIDVNVAIADDLPPAKADPNQLEMALLNLAVNARDAMPDGGVLTIEAKRESVRAGELTTPKPGNYVLLCVTDTGVGMDEATRARAIEPFFSTKGIGKGTGLGLSMAHGLAAQLGGALTIDSTPGRGTTIELWLPVSLKLNDTDEAAASEPKMRQRRGRALLVDDEELVRMSTADMLIDLGFEVIEADSAEEALRIVERGTRPDLLVTDHLMPGMSGADLARKLRAGRPDLPVLIVSGYAETDGVAADLPRLTKPFRNAELAAKLDEVVGPENSRAADVL